MRRRSAAMSREHPVSSVNVTPMIDVVMVLIVFYLIVGRLVLERQGRVDLPISVAGEKVPEHADPIIVGVERDGSIWIDGRQVQSDELPDALAMRNNMRVRVRADRTLPFDQVRPILDACRAVGIRSIELATEQGP